MTYQQPAYVRCSIQPLKGEIWKTLLTSHSAKHAESSVGFWYITKNHQILHAASVAVNLKDGKFAPDTKVKLVADFERLKLPVLRATIDTSVFIQWWLHVAAIFASRLAVGFLKMFREFTIQCMWEWKTLRQSWYRHHGIIKLSALAALCLSVMLLYSGGQI